MAAHDLSLFLIGDRNIEADQDSLSLTDLAVYRVIAAAGFVVVGNDANLASQTEFIFFQIRVNIRDDSRRNIIAEKESVSSPSFVIS